MAKRFKAKQSSLLRQKPWRHRGPTSLNFAKPILSSPADSSMSANPTISLPFHNLPGTDVKPVPTYPESRDIPCPPEHPNLSTPEPVSQVLFLPLEPVSQVLLPISHILSLPQLPDPSLESRDSCLVSPAPCLVSPAPCLKSPAPCLKSLQSGESAGVPV
jgi:hypothetical protein